MKVVSTEALTKLIQLVKSAFIKVDDVVETSEVTLATVATSGDYDDLSNKLTAGTTVDITNNVINVTSDISTGAALGTTAVQPADLNNKADTNLLNITSTGKNIANWSTNVSNCITEIPQDIKLELNNGTLILKSGSKVYVPNGSGVYTELITTSDISLSLSVVANTRYFLFATAGTSASSITSIYRQTIENSTSGTTIPTNGVFYDITNNKITAVSSGIQETIKMSFPVCSFSTNSSGTISSIDQIFNGFGYIGSTVFALPGIKGFISNGRNADGTLKNTELSLTSVVKAQVSGTYNLKFAITSSGVGVYFYDYDDINNYIYRTDTGARYYDRVVCGDVVISNDIITSFTPKTAFHAVDYNDVIIAEGVKNQRNKSTVVKTWTGTKAEYDAIITKDNNTLYNITDDIQASAYEAYSKNETNTLLTTLLTNLYPVGSIYIGTQSTCPLTTLINGSTWTLVAQNRALWGGNGTNANTTIAAGLPNITGGATGDQSWVSGIAQNAYGAVQISRGMGNSAQGTYGDLPLGFTFDASRSNSIYGASSTVQPPAYRVNVWRRTA